jgi:alpha-tubulin suppressor-like RCC1 family protein
VARRWLGFAAGDVHSCASYTDGSIGCWGANTDGQLGDGTLIQSLGGVSPNVSAKIISVSASDKMTCVATTSHNGVCWGNATGYLGFFFSQNPTSVLGLTSAGVVVAGQNHSCAATNNFLTVYCWGG